MGVRVNESGRVRVGECMSECVRVRGESARVSVGEREYG